MGDRFGRRLATFCVLTIVAVFGFASAFSPNIYILIILRFFVGFGLGGDIVSIALFTEFLPVADRGGALMNIQTVWCFGGIFAALMALIFLPKEASRIALFGLNGWRYLLVVISIMFAVLIPFSLLMPESPRYLLVSNKIKEAQETLERVAYVNEKPVDFEIVHSHERKAQELAETKASFIGIFSRKMIFTTIVTAFIWIIGAFSYYGIAFLTPVYFAVKTDGIYAPYVSSLVVALAEIPSQIIGLFTINTIGRKLTYTFFFLFGSVSTFLLLVPFPYYLLTIVAFISRGGVNGVTSMNWVYTPEVYSTSLRTSAMGFHSALSRISSSVTPWITNYLVINGNALPAIIIFGVAQAIGTIISCCLPVETTGKQLEDFHVSVDAADAQFAVPAEKAEKAEKKSEKELQDLNAPLISNEISADKPVESVQPQQAS